jgi:hypothetical protein
MMTPATVTTGGPPPSPSIERASVVLSLDGELAGDVEDLAVPARPELPRGPEDGDFADVAAAWKGEWPV